MLDDYHPETCIEEKARMRALASYILRLYGDEIKKDRMTNTMKKQKSFPVRGLCVITGEDFLEGESTVARYIGIELTPDDVNVETLNWHQENPLIFSTHMFYFIQWLSANYMRVVDHIQRNFSEMRNLYSKDFRHKRLVDGLVCLLITLRTYTQYGLEIGYFDQESADYILATWRDVIYEVVRDHDANMNNESPGRMYLIALNEMISTGKCIVKNLSETTTKKYSNIIGYSDENFYYLYSDTAYSEVIKFWKGQNIAFPLSKSKAHEALDALGVIKTEVVNNNGKKGVKRTVKFDPDHTGRKRYLTISKEKMLNSISDI